MLRDLARTVAHITRHHESLAELETGRHLRRVIVLLHELLEGHLFKSAQGRLLQFFLFFPLLRLGSCLVLRG